MSFYYSFLFNISRCFLSRKHRVSLLCYIKGDTNIRHKAYNASLIIFEPPSIFIFHIFCKTDALKNISLRKLYANNIDAYIILVLLIICALSPKRRICKTFLCALTGLLVILFLLNYRIFYCSAFNSWQ